MASDHPGLLAVVADPTRANHLSVEEATLMLAQVAAVKAVLLARLAAPPSAISPRQQREDDRLISVDEAGARLGVAPRWLYRHSGHLPFARRLSRKVLRFSEVGPQQWQAARGRGDDPGALLRRQESEQEAAESGGLEGFSLRSTTWVGTRTMCNVWRSVPLT